MKMHKARTKQTMLNPVERTCERTRGVETIRSGADGGNAADQRQSYY